MSIYEIIIVGLAIVGLAWILFEGRKEGPDFVFGVIFIWAVLTLGIFASMAMYSDFKTPHYVVDTQLEIDSYKVIDGKLRVDFWEDGKTKDIKFEDVDSYFLLQNGGRLIRNEWFKDTKVGRNDSGVKYLIVK